MKTIRKTIIVVIVFAAIVLAPARGQAQINTQSGSWGTMGGSGSGDNINGGSGSWGGFGNSSIDDNGNGNGSWGNFNMEDPDEYVGLGSGLALLTMAGLGYATLKRKKSDKNALKSH